MRRLAGLLTHRRAGFGANAMAVWALPASRGGAAGRPRAGLAAVPHCYERPTFPDWPYALFSMVHGRTREACEATIAAIAGAGGDRQPPRLPSLPTRRSSDLCYERRTFPDWPYALFSMGHGRTREACEATIAAIAGAV